MSETVKFEVGETYQVRSLGDWDCIFSLTIFSRTDKFITVYDVPGAGHWRVGVRVVGGVETAKPFGTYSMCPTIRADRKEA